MIRSMFGLGKQRNSAAAPSSDESTSDGEMLEVVIGDDDDDDDRGDFMDDIFADLVRSRQAAAGAAPQASSGEGSSSAGKGTRTLEDLMAGAGDDYSDVVIASATEAVTDNTAGEKSQLR